MSDVTDYTNNRSTVDLAKSQFLETIAVLLDLNDCS